MGWTAPSATVTGQLITSAFWNAQVTNNMSLLKTSIMDDGTLKVCPYAPTLANVINTTTETTVVSWLVPGSDIADGDGIILSLAVIFRCNAPGSPHTLQKLYWGGTSVSLGDIATGNTSVDRNWILHYLMWRAGSDLWATAVEATARSIVGEGNLDPSGVGNAVIMTTPTFGSTQTVALKITFDQAFTNYYFKPQAARLLRWKQ